MNFEPIAIIGNACLFPGALNPGELWDVALHERDVLSQVPEGYWRTEPDLVRASSPDDSADKTWCDIGGYVQGFESVFDPTGFYIGSDEILGFDPLVHWVLHTGREALMDASCFKNRNLNMGAVFGNLSYPSHSLNQFSESIWLASQGPGFMGGKADELAGLNRPDAVNRFMSGLPAHILARALGLKAGAFALDTACASSLYAIKLACDQLHDNRADLMLAGGVNRADDLIVHIGFCALKALSPSCRSRPYHRRADGLVPSQGAGFVVLKRLTDAVKTGDRIHGVIRGIGLSNDGSSQGPLAPSVEGQVQAIRKAYQMSGLTPADISLVEGHATGTPTGDRVEIHSMSRVYQGLKNVPIGSIKSNIGHPVTASGMAGLIKVLGAIRSGVRPPTLNADEPMTELENSPFRLLAQPEDWRCSGLRRAAINNFGFGGNNAHMIVEGWEPAAVIVPHNTELKTGPPSDIAIVGLGGIVAKAPDMEAFAQALFLGKQQLSPQDNGTFSGSALPFDLPLMGLGVAPADLDQALAQQLISIKAALEAAADAGAIDSKRTAVMVGMGCDAEAARSGLCWRLPGYVRQWQPNWDTTDIGQWLSIAMDRIHPMREAAAILGAMPNMTANRINTLFDLTAFGLTVSAEELSGMHCLEIAIRGLRVNDIDTAFVGGVDLCCEPVHEMAAETVLDTDRQIPGDAAVMIILKRAEDARRDNNKIYALISDTAAPEPTLRLGLGNGCLNLTPLFGHAQCASGLVHVAAAALACHHKRRPVNPGGPEQPWTVAQGPRSALVTVDALGNASGNLQLVEDLATPRVPGKEISPQPQRPPTRYRTYAVHPPKIQLPQFPIEGRNFLPTAIADISLDTLIGHHTDLSSAHAGYLLQMAKAHQHFLTSRQKAMELLKKTVPRANPPPLHAPSKSCQPPDVYADIGDCSDHAMPNPAGADCITGSPPGSPVGPTFSFEQLKVFASGNISEVFGPLFKIQDSYHRRVRLPEPPLLLTDRVTGIDAEQGTMGKGVIWTETEVDGDAWYVHDGYMSPGMTVEAGQSDLLLISWLGIDFLNQGERVYRLLGCDFVYHGSPAKAGDTLCYDIHVDGYSEAGGVRIFFFHYNCSINGHRFLSVRNAQAGFFTDQELAESKGIIWSPEASTSNEDARIDPPAVTCARDRFSNEQIKAFSQGRVHECFGSGFEITQTHTRTPKIPSGRMLLIDRVTLFQPTGGPWKRGYLQVENRISPNAWFLSCHFKNDPCMPGTLMSDACLQAMAVYLTGMGYTLNRDGWRFEPVPDHTVRIKCRGQVTPNSQILSYEVYVKEVLAGPYPTLYADLLGICDGLKILHIRGMGLRLVPDWPLDGRPELLEGHVETRTVAGANGMTFGYKSLLACALGRPSDAFGNMARSFDNGRHISRLPGPPYHFASRVSRIDARIGAMRTGEAVEFEYDIPQDAWYFDCNGHRTMPLCVIMEAGLQPCGWLSIFEGALQTTTEDLYFRNLDGTATLKAEVRPESGLLTTRTTLTGVNRISGITLVNFEVVCRVQDKLVFEMKTGFGFFLKEALDQQVGLPATDADRAWLKAPCDFQVDLTHAPEQYFKQEPRLPNPMLLMVDRVTGYWPAGTGYHLARLRAEKKVDPQEWFFKAHFFQDPVQPGSLGVESMVQLLQFYMLHENLHTNIATPRFLPVSLDTPITWKYRGQVTPDKKKITIEMTILDQGRDAHGAYAIAEAWLWADDLRIFHVHGLKVHITGGIARTSDQHVSEEFASITGVARPLRGEIRQEVIRKFKVPPSVVHVQTPEKKAVCDAMPLNLIPFNTDVDQNQRSRITLEDPILDYETINAHARKQLGLESWFGEDYFKSLSRLFTRHLILKTPREFMNIKGHSTLFLGNHQVQIESILFPILAQVLSENPILTIADAKHRYGWVGALDEMIASYPGNTAQNQVIYFDQNDRPSMFRILKRLKKEVTEKGVSVFLHVEGKLGLSCRHPVKKMSSVFVDLALASQMPVVPVRFTGGLPIAPLPHTVDFPIGYGKQDYHIGRPIWPDRLRDLPYADRRKTILMSINSLGPAIHEETPSAPHPDFHKKVTTWQQQTGVSEAQAVLLKSLEMMPGPRTRDTTLLLQAAHGDFTGIGNNANGRWLRQMADWLTPNLASSRR